ncbi:SCP2 sterol-binding domain-containing protein [Parashewanella spongiae]|nr:SCP2 sterol-binding domain-containing protein [Parashewanella spongiae]MCL1079583.1 SCP2 sterol-binding domain-containing protein [Parashewanella spongiae]
MPSFAAKQVLKRVPTIAQHSLSVVPFALKAKIITELLSVLMKEQMEDEELGFLIGRWVAIKVTDFNLSFEVSYDNKWLVREPFEADVTFSADSIALIQVAAGVEDPDTLFFQRQLCIEGDTELGLEVKNLLLAIELDQLPTFMRKSVEQLARGVATLQRKSSEMLHQKNASL